MSKSNIILKAALALSLWAIMSSGYLVAAGTSLPVYGKLGGALNLEATDLARARSENIKMVSFGFARCMQACPLVLAKYAQVLNHLSESDQKPLAMFVSIDPQRDTIKGLEAYIQKFHEAIIGLAGNESQIKIALRQFAAFAEKDPESGDFDHTDRIYLLDARNQVRAMFKPSDSTSTIVNSINTLL